MTNQFYPSVPHAFVHKTVCAIGLLAAMATGIPAVHVLSNRYSAGQQLQGWCETSSCISRPGAFDYEPLVVYADKAKEAAQLVSKLYKPSPLAFLDIAAPQVQSVARAPSSPASSVKGRKKS